MQTKTALRTVALALFMSAFGAAPAVCAAVQPHPDWVNALKPRGEPGPPLTLARDGRTDYVLQVRAEPSTQDQKAAEELDMWLNQMTGADFAIVNESGDVHGGPVISIGRTARLQAVESLPLDR